MHGQIYLLPSTERRLVSEPATGATSQRHDIGVATCSHWQDIPCVQREQSRDPAREISAEYARQVGRLGWRDHRRDAL